jgi:ferric-dicitrate binding protein FerR (iron transport regulator)
MKKIFNILNKKKKYNQDDYNLDQILFDNNLNYSELNFNSDSPDILISYNKLNKTIKTEASVLRNLKSIIPQLNLKPILKPLYTIALTSLVIFAVIKLRSNTEPIQYAEITVDKGEKITLHVTEDLTIYLNSESTIRVPLELNRNSEFQLDGEAYFEVAENKKIKVLSKGAIIEASKSNFYINSKIPDNLIANNISGKLELYNPNFPKDTKLILRENEKAIYNIPAGFMSVETKGNTNYLAWHTGKLEFDGVALSTAINNISEHFNIPIEIKKDTLNNQKFTAQFENLEIDEILDIIQSKLNCKISADGSKIIIN